MQTNIWTSSVKSLAAFAALAVVALAGPPAHAATNKLVNPSFSTATNLTPDGWITLTDPPGLTMTTQWIGNIYATPPGSVFIAIEQPGLDYIVPPAIGLGQCVPVRPGASYGFQSSVYRVSGDRLAAHQRSMRNVRTVEIWFFSDADCNELTGTPVSSTQSATDAGVWTIVSGSAVAPANALSAGVLLKVRSVEALTYDGTTGTEAVVLGFFDDVSFVEILHPGDANEDGKVDIADVFSIINFLFAGGPPLPGRPDANRDGVLTVADVFYIINYLFAGGPP
jgi:hypothetical protein